MTTPINDFLKLKKKGTYYSYRGGIFDFLRYVYSDEKVSWNRRGAGATPEQIQVFEQLAERYIREAKQKKNPRKPIDDLTAYTMAISGENGIKGFERSPKAAGVRIAAVKEFLRKNEIRLDRDDIRGIRNQFFPSTYAISEEQVLTPEIISSILVHLDVRGRALVLVLASSGMRIGEALSLTLDDIDLTKNPARINIRREYTKKRRKRWTFISDEAKNAVNEWLKVRSTYIDRSNRKPARIDADIQNDNRLFGIERTTAHWIWNSAVKRTIIKDLDTGEDRPLYKRDKQTGITEVRIHGLRRFFRSNLERGGIAAGICEKLIGHEGELQGTYAKYTVDQLATEYKRGMQYVTIGQVTDKETTEKVNALAEENRELKKKIKELEALRGNNEFMQERLDRLERALRKIGFDDGDLKPIRENPNPTKLAFPDPLAEEFS